MLSENLFFGGFNECVSAIVLDCGYRCLLLEGIDYPEKNKLILACTNHLAQWHLPVRRMWNMGTVMSILRQGGFYVRITAQDFLPSILMARGLSSLT